MIKVSVSLGWGGGRGCNLAGTTVFWETLPKANIAVKTAP